MNNETVRKALIDWLAHRGHGGIIELAKEVDLTPQWLSQFRNGKVDLGADSLARVAAALAKFARERQDPYVTTEVDRIEAMVCRQLRNLLEMWEAPIEFPWVKWKSMDDFVEIYLKARKQYLAAAKKD